MSNKLYNRLKYTALILLPALATLCATLTEIWSIKYGDSVALTIMAIDTFLGALLKLSSDKYYKDKDEDKEA